MSCKHDCEKPPVFPRTIFNRPALPAIGYRIGAYAEMREHMLDLLNKQPMLAAWTHRAPDDPGIALVESAAIVGDILTFYQQLYANELYLRTAGWRESVAELVRLLGYRLAPGLGGEATFALAVKGDNAVTVPKGFGLKAQLEGQDKPSEFESVEETIAYPWLGRFNLYRPRTTPNTTTGKRKFYVVSSEGIPAGLSFKSGDRVLLGVPHPSAGNPTRIEDAQVLIVDSTWESFGRLYVQFKTGVTVSGSPSQLKAYKLGESYRHFGHNAPPNVVTVSSGTTTSASTSYLRKLHKKTSKDVDPNLQKKEMPLSAEAKQFAPGGFLLIELKLSTSSDLDDPVKYTLVRQIDAVENGSYTWGMLSGASTVLTLDDTLVVPVPGPNYRYADIRSFTFHEVAGAPFTLRAEEQPSGGSSGAHLYFYGTDAEVKPLAGRKLFLAKEGAEALSVAVEAVQTLSAEVADRLRFRRVTIDADVEYADYPHENPVVTVYGNLVSATQGKTQAEVVLGTGDQRQIFQTFALPKAPLTYLLDETQTPAQAAELSVYVDGIEWQRVDSFFNALPDDAVYIVREDEDDKSYVQFGDGKTGRRLPSGINNVTAVYRVGQGAYGALKAGTNPSAATKLTNFDKLFLPAPATGGCVHEDGDNARVAAPGKMQSLGRIVSLADVEAEALAIPHVIKVRAAWSAPEGFPLVRLTVLTESGSTDDLAAVADSMKTFNRCRGPARYPIDVVRGIRQYVYVRIEAGYEPERREADVIAAIKGALGLSGEEGNGIDDSEGLFGLKTRQFGQGAHKSQIIGAAQNATGVRWVKLKAAEIINLGSPPKTDPAELAKPGVDYVATVLACPDDRLLALNALHFTLSLSKDEVAEECEA